jgi:hypothetical protein
MKTYYLKVYRIIEGADNWPLVDTITATAETVNDEGAAQAECIDTAMRRYSPDEYSWTNPTDLL